MQSAMSNGGGLTSPLNSLIRKSINPVYDDSFNPVAGNSWPQYLKNALTITPPRTHTAPTNFGGTPIVLKPVNGAILAVGSLLCGPSSPSAASPNLRIGYAGNQCFEMRAGNSNVVYFQNGGYAGTVVNGAVGYGIDSTGYIGFCSGSVTVTGIDTAWFRPAANSIGLRSIASPTSSQFFHVYSTYTDTSNYERLTLQFVTYSSARYAQLACESAGTGIANMNLVLTPKGTGAFILGPPPDGTATGGNARGVNAIDLQISRSAATDVASGDGTVAIGTQNKASGDLGCLSIGRANNASGRRGCVAIGQSNQAIGLNQNIAIGDNNTSNSPQCAIAIGRNNSCTAINGAAIGNELTVSAEGAKATGSQATADRFGMTAHAAGQFSTYGDCQRVKFLLRNKTTTNSNVTLFLNGSSARLTIPSGKILHATAHIVGSKSDGSACACYLRKVAIKNVGGTTSLIGSVETIGTDTAAGTSIAITADDTNDALQIAVTGIASETWRWVATVEGVELAYGT